MESVTTSRIHHQQGREVLVEALNNCEQHAIIRALIEKYWTWQKQFEHGLDKSTHHANSTPFYCKEKRCLVIGEDKLQTIYADFKSHKLKNDVKAQQDFYKKFSILPLSPLWTVEQIAQITGLHNKLLREDLIEGMQRVFTTDEHLAAVKCFWQYKINRTEKSRIKFINKIYNVKLLELKDKQERLKFKEDFIHIPK